MHLQPHPESDTKACWLTADEMRLLLNQPDDTEREIALSLAGRSGLRSAEVLDVTPVDIVDGPARSMVRVWEGKNDDYRETPVPDGLAGLISGYVDGRDRDADQPIVNVESTRTLRKWIAQARDQAGAETGDDAWKLVSMHDLRRSWGQLLIENDVEPTMVMHWGGWKDWETFRNHYLGVHSAQKQREERDKVAWL